MQGELLKAGDLKPLTDAGLLVLGARMALRVAPWCPTGGEEDWCMAMQDLVRACAGIALPLEAVNLHERRLLEHGALGCYSGVPEAISRSRNQAASVLACALQATQLGARKYRWKMVVQAGKHAASVFAEQAHAGVLPLEDAVTVPWAAARADIERIAVTCQPSSVTDIERLGPLWPGSEPRWAKP